MSWTPNTPITGATQTLLTSPTYTLVVDVAPDNNGIQHAVSAVGGTQTGVAIHSMSSPFTSTFVRPKVFKALGKANPVTGLIASVPRNVFKHITRKGVIPLSGQPSATMLITTTIEVPAGADTADPVSVQAALSLHIGLLNAEAAGVGDSAISGVI